MELSAAKQLADARLPEYAPRIHPPLLRRPTHAEMQSINRGYDWQSTWRLFVELEGCVVELSHIVEGEYGCEVWLMDGQVYLMTAERLTEWYGQLWKGLVI